MTTLKARAKINLFFQITGKRKDGYHLIESLMVFAHDIYDVIEINPAAVNSTSVTDSEFAHLLSEEPNNLINQALQYFAGNTNYHCQLSKNIPIGAGLGGGSADAAIVAKYLNNKKMSNEINQKLIKIGADLPICYHDQPAFCSGIGEVIEQIKNFPILYLVIVNPRKALLTKDVFRDNLCIDTPYIKHKPIDFSTNLNKLIDFLAPLKNDLTEAAILLMPEIKIILDLLDSQKDCKIARMSGSGPSCFGIFADEASAKQASDNIAKLYPQYWVRFSRA